MAFPHLIRAAVAGGPAADALEWVPAVASSGSPEFRWAPRGARGGEDGLPGRSFLNGEELPAIANLDLEPGDLLRVETPGGGGLGAP